MAFGMGLLRRARDGQWLRKGIGFLAAAGREPDAEVGDPGAPKGVLRSKTVVTGLAAAIYGIGLSYGWWDVSEDQFLEIGIPVLIFLGNLWGRMTAKKSIL